MAFRIQGGELFGDGVRRIACEQIDGAIAESCDGSVPGAERIHRIRKRCKKLRGLLRLVRPSLGDIYRRENEHFRDAAQLLAPLRDAQSSLDAYDAVLAQFDGEVERKTFSPLRRRLAARKKRREHHLTDLADRFGGVRGRMEAVRARLADWPLDDDAKGPEVWRAGFERTYRQARRALAAAYREPTTEHFHEWRKNVKYHWYHCRLLSPLWDQELAARAQAADTLGEALGLHHDLAVLRAALAGPRAAGRGGEAVGPFLALVDRHRDHIEATARPLGMRLFAEKASRVGARHERYWLVWLEEVGGRTETVQQVAGARA